MRRSERAMIVLFVYLLIAIAFYAMAHNDLVTWAWQECGGNLLCTIDMGLIPPFG